MFSPGYSVRRAIRVPYKIIRVPPVDFLKTSGGTKHFFTGRGVGRLLGHPVHPNLLNTYAKHRSQVIFACDPKGPDLGRFTAEGWTPIRFPLHDFSRLFRCHTQGCLHRDPSFFYHKQLPKKEEKKEEGSNATGG